MKNNVLAVMVVAAVTGCTSISSVQRADTLGHGKWEVAVEPGVGYDSVVVPGLGFSAVRSELVLPHVDAAFRYGVSDNVDLGVRAGISGLELQSKIRLTDASQRFVVSLAPTVGGTWYSASAALPVLMGLKLGRHEMTLGLRAQALYSAPANTVRFMPAASIGFAFQITDHFTLMPEFAAAFPLVTQTFDSSGANSGDFVIGQFKLGVQFGSARL